MNLPELLCPHNSHRSSLVTLITHKRYVLNDRNVRNACFATHHHSILPSTSAFAFRTEWLWNFVFNAQLFICRFIVRFKSVNWFLWGGCSGGLCSERRTAAEWRSGEVSAVLTSFGRARHGIVNKSPYYFVKHLIYFDIRFFAVVHVPCSGLYNLIKEKRQMQPYAWQPWHIAKAPTERMGNKSSGSADMYLVHTISAYLHAVRDNACTIPLKMKWKESHKHHQINIQLK